MRSQTIWLLISCICLNGEDADVKHEGKYLCVTDMMERFSSLKTMDLRFSMIASQRQNTTTLEDMNTKQSLVWF